jgi:hypothetical protein
MVTRRIGICLGITHDYSSMMSHSIARVRASPSHSWLPSRHSALPFVMCHDGTGLRGERAEARFFGVRTENGPPQMAQEPRSGSIRFKATCSDPRTSIPRPDNIGRFGPTLAENIRVLRPTLRENGPTIIENSPTTSARHYISRERLTRAPRRRVAGCSTAASVPAAAGCE